jgi:glutamate synthase (NADPH/NADH) large chain
VATQNPELRARFTGRPEFVVTFFEYIAEEVRELLAQLGFRSVQEAIGHVEALDVRAAVDHWKASGLDLSPILAPPENPYGQTFFHSVGQDHGLERALDQELIERCRPAIDDGRPVAVELPVRNVNRTVGTLLGSAVTAVWGGDGLPDGTIDIHLRGSAGQSFGAFVPRGITLRLEGDANDYVGKGLSGGRLILHPDRDARFAAEDNIIAGNVSAPAPPPAAAVLRVVGGASACNSGPRPSSRAWATTAASTDRWAVVVLGPTGRNFGAGMSGAWLSRPDGAFPAGQPRDGELGRSTRTPRALGRSSNATGSDRSTVAEQVLLGWSTEAPHFRKVMPKDYRRVLAVLRGGAGRAVGGRDDGQGDGGGSWVRRRAS